MMASLNGTLPLPNPLTPLAFIPPKLAYEVTVANYLTVGALAVFIWDILDNATWDYSLHFKGSMRFNIPLMAYIFSRIGMLGILLSTAIFSTAPTGICLTFNKIFHAWCPVAISSNALLFFIRLRAVYNSNKITNKRINKLIVALFFTLWIGLAVANIFITIGTYGAAVGPTQYCQYLSSTEAALVGLIAPLVYHTPVFAAISWRLSRIGSAEMGYRDSIRVLFSGKGLPVLARSLLIDGQVYYLLTMIGGVATAVLLYTPEVSPPLRSIGINPYIALVNIMASRVFRRTRAGLIRESEISTSALAEAMAYSHHSISFSNHSGGSCGTEIEHPV